MLKLIQLTPDYRDALMDMIAEWVEDQRTNGTNHSPSILFEQDPRDFEAYIRSLERKEPVNGKVPCSTYFLLEEESDRLLGAANIRHYLNAELLDHGGHIGAGIRPTERKKGYGTQLIALALEKCGQLGIDRVLITCDKDNIGSAKAIQRNGGILEDERTNEDGVLEQRYWIELNPIKK